MIIGMEPLSKIISGKATPFTCYKNFKWKPYKLLKTMLLLAVLIVFHATSCTDNRTGFCKIKMVTKMKGDYYLQHVCSTLLKSHLYNIMTSINKKTTSTQTNKMTVSIILLLLRILPQKGHPWMMLHMHAFIINRPFNRFLFPLDFC